MTKIAFLAAEQTEAQESKKFLEAKYPPTPIDQAEIAVILGGDGFMLKCLHESLGKSLRLYGMNRGTVGFLLNNYHTDDLLDRLQKAQPVTLNPLRMRAGDIHGKTWEAIAINEVSVFRETRQAAHVRISIDGKVRMEELVCDGIMLATPAGSTAYNLSAHGPILPLDSGTLALTPISAFRPRRWRGALIKRSAQVRFDTMENAKRPVSAVADNQEFRDITWVEAEVENELALTLLFDPEHSLEERILNEQFIP
jgi:NAD+ kinase